MALCSVWLIQLWRWTGLLLLPQMVSIEYQDLDGHVRPFTNTIMAHIAMAYTVMAHTVVA